MSESTVPVCWTRQGHDGKAPHTGLQLMDTPYINAMLKASYFEVC